MKGTNKKQPLPDKIPKHLKDIPKTEFKFDYLDKFWSSTGWFTMIFLTLMAWAVYYDRSYIPRRSLYIFVIGFLLGIYWAIFRKLLRNRYKKLNPRMEDDYIIYKWPFGIKKRHSYAEWAESVNNGHYKVGSRGYEFRLGFERLVFFYNVGIADDRKKSQQRYEFFVDKLLREDPSIGAKLPQFTKSNIDLLDKRCYYHIARRNILIFDGINFLVFLFLGSFGGRTGVIATTAIAGLFQGIIYYYCFKTAYYDLQNEKKIKEKLPDETGLVQDDGIGALRPYWGYVYAILVVVITYLIQCYTIWY